MGLYCMGLFDGFDLHQWFQYCSILAALFRRQAHNRGRMIPDRIAAVRIVISRTAKAIAFALVGGRIGVISARSAVVVWGCHSCADGSCTNAHTHATALRDKRRPDRRRPHEHRRRGHRFDTLRHQASVETHAIPRMAATAMEMTVRYDMGISFLRVAQYSPMPMRILIKIAHSGTP